MMVPCRHESLRRPRPRGARSICSHRVSLRPQSHSSLRVPAHIHMRQRMNRRYGESGSDQGAADKAINRWLKAGRVVEKEGGVYELGNG